MKLSLISTLCLRWLINSSKKSCLYQKKIFEILSIEQTFYSASLCVSTEIYFNNNFKLWLGWPRRIGSLSEVRRFGTDESIFGRNSDPIAESEAKDFENSIRFNFQFFHRIGSDSFLFYVGLEEKNCFRSDPTATLIVTESIYIHSEK